MNIFKKLYGRKKFKTIEQENREAKRIETISESLRLVHAYRDTKNKLPLDKKISLLQQIAEEVTYPATSQYLSRRRISQKFRGLCDVCRKNKAFFKHHLIMLKNGGPNKKWNLIPICSSCHELVHPWLNKRFTKQQKTMDSEFLAVCQ